MNTLQAVKSVRKRSKLNQRQLAARIEVTPQTMRRYELGAVPNFKALTALRDLAIYEDWTDLAEVFQRQLLRQAGTGVERIISAGVEVQVIPVGELTQIANAIIDAWEAWDGIRGECEKRGMLLSGYGLEVAEDLAKGLKTALDGLYPYGGRGIEGTIVRK